jgi:hypothetical protein
MDMYYGAVRIGKWQWFTTALGHALLFFVPLFCIYNFVLSYPANQVIKQWTQPSDINYQSYDPYCLSVIEGPRRWINPANLERTHYIFIGRGTDAPSYGLYLDFNFFGYGKAETDAHIAASKVEWNTDGVTFIEASGRRLFIPAAAFTGGR